MALLLPIEPGNSWLYGLIVCWSITREEKNKSRVFWSITSKLNTLNTLHTVVHSPKSTEHSFSATLQLLVICPTTCSCQDSKGYPLYLDKDLHVAFIHSSRCYHNCQPTLVTLKQLWAHHIHFTITASISKRDVGHRESLGGWTENLLSNKRNRMKTHPI